MNTAVISEMVGTALLIILGNGVVANVVLPKTKGNNSGWIVITFGWAIAVFVAVYAIAAKSGAHINPAVTLGDALHSGDWSKVVTYIPAQLIGAFIGACIVYLLYKPHFEEADDSDGVLACFATGPAIRHTWYNLLSEVVGTMVLMLGVLTMSHNEQSVTLGPLDALPVALLVLGIGLSLGGTTGYAINPARDLGPRLAHAILPIRGKRDSDWSYGWIPVVGPFLGAGLAVVLYGLIW